MTSGLLRRAGDRLWRVDFHDPLLAPLIILLEFQSTPDPRMAWRILEYRTLALEEAVKQGVAGPNGLRPLFLAIVIYNGTEAWNDPAAGERPVPKNLLDFRVAATLSFARHACGRHVWPAAGQPGHRGSQD